MDPGFSWRNDGRVGRLAVECEETHTHRLACTHVCHAVVHLRRRAAAAAADVTEKPERLTPPEVVIGQRDVTADEPKEEEEGKEEGKKKTAVCSFKQRHSAR